MRACTPAITTWLTPRRFSITSSAVPKKADQRFLTRYMSPAERNEREGNEGRQRALETRYAPITCEMGGLRTVADAERLHDLCAVRPRGANARSALLEMVLSGLLHVDSGLVMLSADPDHRDARHASGLHRSLHEGNDLNPSLDAQGALRQHKVVLRDNAMIARCHPRRKSNNAAKKRRKWT